MSLYASKSDIRDGFPLHIYMHIYISNMCMFSSTLMADTCVTKNYEGSNTEHYYRFAMNKGVI